MEPLKDQFFNREFYQKLTSDLKRIYPKLDAELFFQDVQKDHKTLELMQRLELASDSLKKHLPASYPDSVEIIRELAPEINGFAGMVLPNFVQKFGLEHFDLSLETLKFLTPFSSSEFAIRVFLKRDFQKTIRAMETWSRDENHHVRRLSSEGSRPRLPWSFKLEEVIKKPKATAKILHNLKADPEDYVQKSVGNHLNDISKDHPDYVLKTLRLWNLQNQHTSRIAKRAARTMIKAGHQDAFALLGYDKRPQLNVSPLRLENTIVAIGGELSFAFDVVSTAPQKQKINIDYLVYYRKKNGALQPKVFKLKSLNLDKNHEMTISKKHRFENLTTRKHYPGIHQIRLSVNGFLQDPVDFEVIL